MSSIWVIETSGFDSDNSNKIINSLKKLNIEYIEFKYVPFMNYKDIYEKLGDFNRPVISYGSINFISKIQKIEKYIPGSFSNFRRFEYKNYSTPLKNLLLNDRYMILTWEEFKRKESEIFRSFGGKFFCRPNSGKKIFSGMIFYEDYYMSDLAMELSKINNDTVLILSPEKDIILEWRYFVSKGKVITGSQFHKNGNLNITNEIDKNSLELAKYASTIIQPDPIFVIDVCKLKDESYKVVELNSFSCSGIYECDTDKIVEEVQSILEIKDE